MTLLFIILVIIILFLLGNYFVKNRSLESTSKIRSKLYYYGLYLSLFTALPSLLIAYICVIIFDYIFVVTDLFNQIFFLLIFTVSIIAFGYNNLKKIQAAFNAMLQVETFALYAMMFITGIIVCISCLIIISLFSEAIWFFDFVSLDKFLFGLNWYPQSFGNDLEDSFGIIPLLFGTLFITFIAVIFAVVVGVGTAIYITEYAKLNFVYTLILKVAASIPSVIYGFFAVIILNPICQDIANYFNLTMSSESALLAGLAVGIMLVPFLTLLLTDSLAAVPIDIKNASYALGATKAETIFITLFTARADILSALSLSFSRALGETMIVVMTAGLIPSITLNPLEANTTITVQISSLLISDTQFDDPITLSAFALSVALFILTLVFNSIALFYSFKFSKNY